MIYYDEDGNIIPESAVDLNHGYLEDKDILHHDEIPRKTHLEYLPLPSGNKCVKEVVDQEYVPAWDEVTSQIYHYTGPTEEETMRLQLDQAMLDIYNLRPDTIAYTIKTIPSDTWVVMIAKNVPKGKYSVITNADEYKMFKGERELENGFMPDDGQIVVKVKVVNSGDYSVKLIKE